MNRKILSAVSLALAFVFTMPQSAAAATTGTGSVGDHFSEAHCNFDPAPTDMYGRKIGTSRDYIGVWGGMLASPIQPVTTGNTVLIGGGGSNGHTQRVAMHAILFKFDTATRKWVSQPERAPWWATTVPDAAWNYFPEYSIWTNISLDLPNYPYSYTQFTIPGPGDYRVAVEFYWYADTLAPSGYDYRWVDTYLDDQSLVMQNISSAGWCHFAPHPITTIAIGG